MSVMAFLSSPVPLNRYSPRDWQFTIMVNHLADVLRFQQIQKTRGLKKVAEKTGQSERFDSI